MKRVTAKDISEGIHAYGKVSCTTCNGRQFMYPFNWRDEHHSFQFLIYAFGQKTRVVRRIAEIINTRIDSDIEKYTDFVKCNGKIPFQVKGGTGLNCF